MKQLSWIRKNHLLISIILLILGLLSLGAGAYFIFIIEAEGWLLAELDKTVFRGMGVFFLVLSGMFFSLLILFRKKIRKG